MKILRLDLLAFGPFADAPPLVLGEGNRGLHLIHGPNEAGKSSTLRALRGLLFGFPRATSDNHRHAYADLRVGAILRGESGEELAFIRRKKDVQSLRTADDSAVLPDDALRPFLAGLDAKRFDDLFAMDHAELVDGGKAIVAGGGNLGSILFAAGSGLARLDEVRKALESDMAALFKERGKLPAINRGLDELKEARALADQRMMPTLRWLECEEDCRRAIAEKEAVDAKWRQLDAERRRLERLRDALPMLARRDQAARALADLGDVPILAEGFAERRREASVARDAGLKALRDAERTIASLDAELEGFGPPDPALAESDAVRALRDDLGLYLRALADRPALADRLARLESDADLLRSGLGPGVGSEGEPGRVPPALREAIQALTREHDRIEDRHDRASAELASRAESAHADAPAEAPRLAEALAEAVERTQKAGDLEGLLASARAELTQAEDQAAVDLRGLAPWSGTLDELEALAVPTAATLDLFERRWQDADDALARAEAERDRAEADLEALDREADAIDGQGDSAVPTEEALADRRLARDEGWRKVRRAWAEGEPAGSPPALELASDYEASVRAADDHADRLRREADRVAERAQRDARRRGLVARISDLSAQVERRRRERDGVAREWGGAWDATGIDPLSPREMKEWVAQKRGDLVRQARSIRSLRTRVEQQAERVAAARAELGRGLESLGWPASEPGETLFAAMGRARAAIARVAGSVALAKARAELEAAAADRLAWRDRWSAAVAPLGLDAAASPARAQAVAQQVDDLADLSREIRNLRAEIDEQDRLSGRFEAAVAGLASRIAPDLAGLAADAGARDLLARLDRARVIEVKRADRLKQRADQEANRERARLGVDHAEASLATLAREARVASPEALPDAERASDEARRQRDRLRELDEQLAILAGPAGVDRLCAEAEAEADGSIDDRIGELVEQLTPLEESRNRLGEEVGRRRERFDAIDGGPAAAEAEQEVEEKVARLAGDVARYVRLRLASAALDAAIERHREKNQGPVLARAGALFAGLTAGSFSGLRADVDEKGEPVLLGIRGDGSTLVGVDGMSEGTADQLYLALRLASLSAHLDRHEPMPMVIDDILVNFDNARSVAALRALADLSTRTQILFFTHHEHLVDLARSALPPDVLFVHSLDSSISVPRDPTIAPASPSTPAPKGGRRKKASPTPLLDGA